MLIWIALANFLITPAVGIVGAAPSHLDPPALQSYSPFGGEGRIYYTSHYVIEYDTLNVAAHAMADRLENLLKLFLKVFGKDFNLQVPEERMKVCLFKTEEKFRKYVIARAPRMADYYGMYDSNIKYLILLDPHGSPGYQKAAAALEILKHRIEQTRRNLEFHEQRLTGKVPGSTSRGQQWLSDQKRRFEEIKERKLRAELELKRKALKQFYVASLHEGVHQLRDFTGIWSVAPLWLEEGIAEYFANADYAHKRAVSAGKINKHALKTFKKAYSDGNLIPLARLLTWGVATPLSHQAIEKEKIPVAYSEFWALFHFFLHAEKGKWRNSLISYIKDLRKNPPSLENREEHLTRFQRLLSSDLAAFERYWIKTVLNGVE